MLVIQKVYGSVVGPFQADEQARVLLRGKDPAERAQNLRQGLGARFGRSAAAGHQRRQTDLLARHRALLWARPHTASPVIVGVERATNNLTGEHAPTAGIEWRRSVLPASG